MTHKVCSRDAVVQDAPAPGLDLSFNEDEVRLTLPGGEIIAVEYSDVEATRELDGHDGLVVWIHNKSGEVVLGVYVSALLKEASEAKPVGGFLPEFRVKKHYPGAGR